MKRLSLSLALLLLTAFPARATLFVQQVKNGVATSATAVSVSVTTASGSLVIGFCGENVNTTSTVTMSDSGSNTWLQTGSYNTGSGTLKSGFFHVPNAAAISGTITCTWSGSISGRINMVIWEVTGAPTSAADDVSGNSSGNSVTSLASASITTHTNDEILFYGVLYSAGVSAESADNGFAFPSGSIGTRIDTACKIVTTTQSGLVVTTSWTTTAGAEGIFATYKAASAGGTGSCTPSGAPAPTGRFSLLGVGSSLRFITPRVIWKRE